jgi:glycerol kinase
MARFVSIDQGTTSTRALVVEDNGSISIARSVTHAQHYPNSGWVEHDAEELLANVIACLDAAGPATAIGLSNQGESCLAWDAATGRPLSPVIVWQDDRTSDIIEKLRADGHAPMVLERAGLPLDPYFSAAKFRWIIDNLPDAARALDEGRLRLGTTDAFFLQRLTGRAVTDISTASRTSLMNLRTGQWDAELCALFDVPMDCLPDILPTVGNFGVLGTGPVTAAMVDQQAALYGHGCREPGDLKITFGTGAFCLAIANGIPDPAKLPDGLLPTVAWQIDGKTTYALDGGVYDVGSAIEWAQKSGLAKDLADFQSFDRPPAISRDLVFVPAFSGLACPYWDRSAAPVIIGLSHASDIADIRQAMLEGIALLTCDVITAMAREVAIGATISIDGGVSRNAYFCQFLADSSGKVISVSEMDEITAFGAAQLAAVGAGVTLSIPPDTSSKLYPPRDVPRTIWHDRFHDAVGRTKQWK